MHWNWCRWSRSHRLGPWKKGRLDTSRWSRSQSQSQKARFDSDSLQLQASGFWLSESLVHTLLYPSPKDWSLNSFSVRISLTPCADSCRCSQCSILNKSNGNPFCSRQGRNTPKKGDGVKEKTTHNMVSLSWIVDFQYHLVKIQKALTKKNRL